MHTRQLVIFIFVTAALTAPLVSVAAPADAQRAPARVPASRPALPRTADGKPNLSGIWQVRNTAAVDLQDHVARLNMPAGRSVVVGNEIPYQPWAAAKKLENYQARQTADPFAQCYMPGVPRIMYLDLPFQIFHTPTVIAMTFEWSHVHRMVYTDGSPHPDGIDFWMGDSRGRWEGHTLVVEVTNHNDRTWFDMAGNFHSEDMKVIEKYRMSDRDTLQYEATIEDPKVFTKPWTISLPLYRHRILDRVLEYVCQAEVEEATGAFMRELRTWYPGPSGGSSLPAAAGPSTASPKAAPLKRIKRMANGKPDFQGAYRSDNGGANYGLEYHADDPLTPGGRGVITDPPDHELPMQPWAATEREARSRPERGYDDPTAHCFAAGVPRSMYVPAPFQIVQTSDHVVFLHERMAWRIVPTDGRSHLPDHMRLWQGDSVGQWDGDTLVVDTANLNGKTWLNEVGDVLSHAAHIVERFTPVDQDTISYQATITDPIAYTRPWTIGFPIRRQKGELLEIACHEDDQDLAHLKAVKAAAAQKKMK